MKQKPESFGLNARDQAGFLIPLQFFSPASPPAPLVSVCCPSQTKSGETTGENLPETIQVAIEELLLYFFSKSSFT